MVIFIFIIGGNWVIFKENPILASTAHRITSKNISNSGSKNPCLKGNIDVGNFRSLLIELFVVSILYTHFASANEWQTEGGCEPEKQELSRKQFALAVLTLAANSLTPVSQDDIDYSFDELDKNDSGTVSFLELCQYCSGIILPEIDRETKNSLLPKFFGVQEGAVDLAKELKGGPKVYQESAGSFRTKTLNAIDVLADKMYLDHGLVMQLTHSLEKVNFSPRRKVNDQSFFESSSSLTLPSATTVDYFAEDNIPVVPDVDVEEN